MDQTLVPGGFLLGATLAARRYRQQAEESEADVTPSEVAADDSAASSSDDARS